MVLLNRSTANNKKEVQSAFASSTPSGSAPLSGGIDTKAPSNISPAAQKEDQSRKDKGLSPINYYAGNMKVSKDEFNAYNSRLGFEGVDANYTQKGYTPEVRALLAQQQGTPENSQFKQAQNQDLQNYANNLNNPTLENIPQQQQGNQQIQIAPTGLSAIAINVGPDGKLTYGLDKKTITAATAAVGVSAVIAGIIAATGMTSAGATAVVSNEVKASAAATTSAGTESVVGGIKAWGSKIFSSLGPLGKAALGIFGLNSIIGAQNQKVQNLQSAIGKIGPQGSNIYQQVQYGGITARQGLKQIDDMNKEIDRLESAIKTAGIFSKDVLLSKKMEDIKSDIQAQRVQLQAYQDQILAFAQGQTPQDIQQMDIASQAELIAFFNEQQNKTNNNPLS